MDDIIAEKCDQKFCICTSHEDYAEIRAHRVENAQNRLVKPTPVEENEPEYDVLLQVVEIEDEGTSTNSDTVEDSEQIEASENQEAQTLVEEPPMFEG